METQMSRGILLASLVLTLSMLLAPGSTSEQDLPAKVPQSGKTLGTIWAFWDIFKSHPGNRLVRCGIITLFVFLAMAGLSWIPNFPIWYLGPLLFSLCMLTMFFLIQRGYATLRNRRKPKQV
jgi:hypothetical protein